MTDEAQTITHLEADLNASRAREELATARAVKVEAERDALAATADRAEKGGA